MVNIATTNKLDDLMDVPENVRIKTNKYLERYRKKPMMVVDHEGYFVAEEPVTDDEFCVSHAYTGKLGTIAELPEIEQTKVSKVYFRNRDIMPFIYGLRKKLINPIYMFFKFPFWKRGK